MEKLKEQGLCKHTGVSNFTAVHIAELSQTWRIKPSLNSVRRNILNFTDIQIQYHPYCSHLKRVIETVEACKKEGIAISAYTSLAPLFRSVDGPLDPVLSEIEEKKGLTPAQALFMWAMHETDGPLVTSVENFSQVYADCSVTDREERMMEYLRIFEVDELDADDIEKITEAGKKRDYEHTWFSD